MTAHALRAALVVAAACAASCARPAATSDGGAGPPAAGAVVLPGGDGARPVTVQVDGVPSGDGVAARVTADRPQWVMATGFRSGTDAGKVIVFDRDGSRAADYRLPTLAPFRFAAGPAETPQERASGIWRRQTMTAGIGQIVPFRAGGRRFLLVGACGRWAPSLVVLLEFGADGRMAERVRFWNCGSVRSVFHDDARIGFLGVNNDLDAGSLNAALGEQYAMVVGVCDIPPPDTDTLVVGQSPSARSEEAPNGQGYRLYVRLPAVQSARSDVVDYPAFDGDDVVLSDALGHRVRVGVSGGGLRVADRDGKTVPEDALPARGRIWRP